MIKKILICIFCFLALQGLFDSTSVSFAQAELSQVSNEIDSFNPLDRLLTRLYELFHSGRNMVFILSGFSLLLMGYGWATKGDIDFQSLMWFIIVLSILATAGWFIDAVVYDIASVAGISVQDGNGTVADKIGNDRIILKNIGPYK